MHKSALDRCMSISSTAMGGKAGCVVITHTLVGRQMWWWEFAETIHCLSSQCCKMQDHHLRVRMGKQVMER